MNDRHDAGPLVRAWLHEVPALADRDRVIDRVRAQVHATGQQRSRWATRWVQVPSRPIPTALVAAVAIVALGSGAVLLAARQQPSQVAGPAATPTLVVATVAPGVDHVLGDGLRDFDRPEDTSINKTGIGPDGTIWMLESDRLFKAGAPGTFARDGVGRPDEPNWVPGFHDDIQVAHDGTLFTESWPVRSFDGTDWKGEREGYLFPGQADGAIWAYSTDLIARWDDGHWTESSVPGVWGGAPWAAVAVGTVVWMGLFDPDRVQDVGRLWRLVRFDGDTVEEVVVPGAPADASPTLIAAGPDGTLWIYLWDRAQAGHLARLTSDGWTVYHEEDGVPIVIDFYQGALGFMAVGPDGSVWLTPQTARGADDCGGVVHFDGSAWTTYLEDTCIVDLDVASDGTAWVQTATPGSGGGASVAAATYRITPSP